MDYNVYSTTTRKLVTVIWGRTIESARRLAEMKYGAVVLVPQGV